MILALNAVSFSYGDTSVLRDVSLSMDTNEIVCVVGPNGSGKTTLLDCVTGFLRPQSGEVRISDKPLSDYRKQELARLIAYVPQQHHPTFPYSVRDVVLMGRTAYTGFLGSYSCDDVQACEAAMRQVGIEELSDRPYHTLSGGELKLVMLARALVQQPRLIVLDEPTASLDFQNELRFLETLTVLVRQKNISALIATHALNHAFFFARSEIPVRTALLAKGHPMQLGTPDEILTAQTLADTFGVEAVIHETAADDASLRQITLLRTIKKDDQE